MSDVVKGHVNPGYERVKEIYQQVGASNNTQHSFHCVYVIHEGVSSCYETLRQKFQNTLNICYSVIWL